MVERASVYSVNDSDFIHEDDHDRYTTTKQVPKASGHTKTVLATPTGNNHHVPPTRNTSPQHDSKTTEDICVRLKHHKHSIIGVFFGIILTVIIIVPILVTRSCDTEVVHGYKFDLRINRSSIHPDLFTSTDNSIMSNIFTKEIPISVSNSEQLKQYTGPFGNRCFRNEEKMYFETKFAFTVTSILFSHIGDANLVAEIGLVDPNKADNHHYVGGSDGWSYHIHNCADKICLAAQHYNKGIDIDIKTVSSSKIKGTHVKGNLGFFVNRNRNEFSVIDLETLKILHTFKQVTSHDTLCPIFGVYNPEMISAFDFTTVPIINVIA